MEVPVIGRRVLRALLVDDDEGMRQPHARQLSAQGYEVTPAHDMESGLALARSLHPEIIFLHLKRPGAPAVGFLQKLRADDSMRHIPVSMLAGQGSARLKKLGLNTVKGDDW